MDFGSLNDAVLDAFGETVVCRRDGQPDTVVCAIYDSRHYLTGDGEAGMSDLITSVSLKAADVPGIAVETVILARELEYRVRDIRPDGKGMLVLVLERAA